jgi:ribose transport system ATP-binding protein
MTAGVNAIPPSGFGEKRGEADYILRLTGISKSFESTRALDRVDLDVGRGEILGIMGHNGAGKSTLVKIISGSLRADGGVLTVGGSAVPEPFSVQTARTLGISIAAQEILLCPQLRIYENALVVHPQLGGRRWKQRVSELLVGVLDEIFPGTKIDPGRRVERLSLAERQMLQTALAAAPTGSPLRLLILDEPTSALGAEAGSQMFEYFRKKSDESKLSLIVISHKVADILSYTQRTIVMRDGRIVADAPSAGWTVGKIMGYMSGEDFREEHGDRHKENGGQPGRREVPGQALFRTPHAGALVDASHFRTRALELTDLKVFPGEIVGLAGLAGNGQQEVLDVIWRSASWWARLAARRHGKLLVKATLGYVTGDRQVRGLFPLWGTDRNITAAALRDVSRLGFIRRRQHLKVAARWIDALSIKAEADTPVMDLSGGTQQKVLLARGLAAEPQLLLLDDPFRGVDITTKVEAYRSMREQCKEGRGFLWSSSENAELLQCDRVYVLQAGRIAKEIERAELTEDQVIRASFVQVPNEKQD